jgi:peptide/nickel transport system permease protein
MWFIRYLATRAVFLVPQILGIVLVSFFLIKTIPGDPAVLMLGPLAQPESLEKLRSEMDLDQPLIIQFFNYVERMAHGDLGTSWQTTRPVIEDLLIRFPATLELVSFSLLLALSIGVPLGAAAARGRPQWLCAMADTYGLAAGAIPDFWLALILIYIFYTILGWTPPPLGRLDFAYFPPPTVTGMYTIDSLLAGDLATFRASLSQLVLPVITLGTINAAPILKMTRATVEKMLQADYSQYQDLCGLPPRLIQRHALRNALPSIVTVVSVLYGFLLGGAVLVEIVFSWGGAGQYAVAGVLNTDINAVLGFILFSAIFSLIVYLVVDIIYLLIDPRIRK